VNTFNLKEAGFLVLLLKLLSVIRGKPVLVTPETFLEIESMGLAYDGSDSASKALKLSLELSDQAVWPLTVVIITSDAEKADTLSTQIEEMHQKEINCPDS